MLLSCVGDTHTSVLPASQQFLQVNKGSLSFSFVALEKTLGKRLCHGVLFREVRSSLDGPSISHTSPWSQPFLK